MKPSFERLEAQLARTPFLCVQMQAILEVMDRKGMRASEGEAASGHGAAYLLGAASGSPA